MIWVIHKKLHSSKVWKIDTGILVLLDPNERTNLLNSESLYDFHKHETKIKPIEFKRAVLNGSINILELKDDIELPSMGY
jgi:hypothetical protein